MNKRLLGIEEAHVASHNIDCIESILGHEIPPGTIDVTSLGDDILGIGEAHIIANNIEYIDRIRNRRRMKFPNERPSAMSLIDKIGVFVFISIPAVFIIGALILSVI